MNIVKSILFFFIPSFLLLVSTVSYGQHAEIIIDAQNGSVLHDLNATHSWYPASLTKLMTLYMVFDALKSEQIHIYDTLTASHHASRQPNSKLGLRQGESLTVKDAILALITRSANDAAVVLSEHLGGTEENFAVKMTSKAHELGMYDSHFMNATGLPHQWQVTTSRDMAMLAWKTLQNFPDYYPYFSYHTFNYKGRELKAINKFTNTYPGAEGMKTGFTCGSGYNLISSASQNGKRLIGVVLGGMTSAERYQLMITMMNNGFSNQSNTYPPKNISTMSPNAAGIPPYQLGCGNMAPTTIASNDNVNSLNTIHASTRSNRHTHSIKPNKKTKYVKKTLSQGAIKTKAKPKIISASKSPKPIIKIQSHNRATKLTKKNYHHP